MNTNRLSKKLASALNAQVTKEAHASQIYLSYASWCERNALCGIAHFLFKHAEEERNHMMKLIEYILKRGAEVKLTAIPAPNENPENLHACFEKVFENETENTKAIYSIVKLSHDEEDWATFNFMQWFVKEQIEEETLAMIMLDKIKLSGGEKMSNNALYLMDMDLGKAEDSVRSAEDITAVNP